jgi:TonB family protein
MRCRAILWFLTLLMSVPLWAEDPKWFEVSSEHFLLYTDAGEAKGRRLLSDFENRVAAFGLAFGKVPRRQFPIEIFLFNKEEDYIEALPRAQGEERLTKNGYLLRGPDRVFIVMKDKSPEDIANDVGHALGHVLFERYVMWRPFWLMEGAAEYVRKVGRSPDTKAISEEDGFTAGDLVTIVPSSTYNDNDPPGAFRIQSHRLLRIFLDEKPDVLKQYFQLLRTEATALPKIDVDVEDLDARLKTYVETALKSPPVTAAIKAAEADPGKLAIHRGDLLFATDRMNEAAKMYNADSKDARAARAIITRFTRPTVEAVRVLDRASRELPDNGLVQYHFGAIETADKKDIALQAAALERAVALMPMMGRAHAELARVHALNGQPEKSLPLLTVAATLEPEYADRFYAIRADVQVALGNLDQAFREINIATELPHPDRSVLEKYTLKITDVRKRIESVRREAAARELDELRTVVRTEAERREPTPKPAPPPPPPPTGTISYEIETRAPIEIVNVVYPDYPDALRAKGVAGKITLQVDVGPDGKVRTATVATSQAPDLNTPTVEAIKRWTFKPATRALNIRVFMTFSLQ